MRQNKKISCVVTWVLSFALLFVMIAPTAVWAAGDPHYIIIKSVQTGYQLDDTHVFAGYQIFSGTIDEATKTLAEIDWGKGVNPEALVNALQSSTIEVPVAKEDNTGETDRKTTIGALFADILQSEDPDEPLSPDNSIVAKNVADVLKKYYNKNESLTGDAAMVQVFADIIGNTAGILTNEKVISSKANGYNGENKSYTLTIPPESFGYYLIQDEAEDLGEGQAKTRYLLRVTTAKLEIEVKADIPTVQKQVQNGSDWANTADYEIGQDISFQLVGTLPNNYDKYETYRYVFTDVIPAGITVNSESVTVKVVNKGESTIIQTLDAATDYTLNIDNVNENGGGTFTVTFADLQKIASVKATSSIIVEYTAQLNEKAVIGNGTTQGSFGNAGTVQLTYSCDPNHDTDENKVNQTPIDKATVFTYSFDATKVNGNGGAAMHNVCFKLAKNHPETAGAYLWATGSVDADTNEAVLTGWSANEDDANVITFTSGADGKFAVKGLDSGTYYLKETKTLDGYEPIKGLLSLKITATLTGNNADEEHKISILTAEPSLTEADNAGGWKDVNANADTGIVSAVITNMPGSALPRTGGIGTTIFYIAGSILVLGGAAYFLFKVLGKNKSDGAKM